MKRCISLLLMISTMAIAEEKHDHGVVAGPKGGKMIESEPQHAEFWVNADRKVEVTFYDNHGTAVAPGDQAVRVTAQAPGGNTALAMEKNASAFVSSDALPEGDGYNIVVQLKATPDEAFQNFRIAYNPATCGECQRPEYACICGH